jgi:hypothetical protein
MGEKEVTVTITYDRRMKELSLMLSQAQLIEEFIKGEIVGMKSGAAAALQKEKEVNQKEGSNG